MSHDPERLLHLRGPGDELERELLASIKHEGPPAHAQDEAWLAIAGRIAALGAAAGTAGTASTATAASSGATAASNASAASAATSATATAGVGAAAAAKTGLSAIATKAAWTCAAGTLALSGYLAVQHVRSEPSAPAQAETAVPSAPLGRGGFQARPLAPTPPAIGPAAQGTAPTAAEPPATAAAPATRRELKPTPPPLDRLSAESALLAAARAQLRAGDARAAEATLARLRARFARGVLVQEREVLAIELLAARGRGAAATRRASAFVRAYPQSPHSAKLNRFLDPP